ncbi:MAG: hypothetical protein KF784_00570 [Fimbriimonadaceae bacterium]|nr:hypothetical protein [Fimbriimonadaceae bacterium]
MLKISKPIWYLLVVVALSAVYMQMSGDESAAAKAKKAKPPAKTAKMPEGVTQEDYTKRFDPLNESVDNSFMPIVARMSSGKNGQMNEPDAIPADLAGGEPGWYFTGTFEIDGAREACVENRSSGVGEFIRTGQSWKRVRITEIGDGTLTMVGPNGQPKTLRLAYGFNDQTVASSSGLRPLDPTLSGNIGGGGAVGISPSNTSGNRRGQGRGNGNSMPATDAGADE